MTQKIYLYKFSAVLETRAGEVCNGQNRLKSLKKRKLNGMYIVSGSISWFRRYRERLGRTLELENMPDLGNLLNYYKQRPSQLNHEYRIFRKITG